MKKCNFKYSREETPLSFRKPHISKELVYYCRLTHAYCGMENASTRDYVCPGEDNCFLFQLYKTIGV